MMDLHWWDAVGFAGVLMVLGPFLELQPGRRLGFGVEIYLLNVVGAAGILVPVVYAEQMNWSVLFIEAAWIAISLYGIWHDFSRRAKAPPPAPG